MQEDKILKRLINRLEQKSDEEVMKELCKNGVNITDYTPGKQGKVILKE